MSDQNFKKTKSDLRVRKEPVVVFSRISDYLSKHAFDLYVVNKYTKPLIGQGSNILVINEVNVREINALLEDLLQRKMRVIGLGAGSVVDAVKYVCKQTGSMFEFAPSALSTNSFATHRNSFSDPIHGKISFDSVVATKIIIDSDLLREADILNRFGLVEVAATATARIDCDIATQKNNENINSDLYAKAKKLTERAVILLSETFSQEKYNDLLECLLESGRLTRLYGNGRLVSGAEHIMSSHIENRIKCPHGMGLLFGFLIARRLQALVGHTDRMVDTITEYLKQDQDMRKYILSLTTAEQIISFLENVRPRKDKFTVLDMVSHDQYMKITKEVVEDYFLLLKQDK